MTKSIEEILKELKNKRSTVFSFNLSIDEVKELEKHRVKFAHEVGKFLGSARMDICMGGLSKIIVKLLVNKNIFKFGGNYEL